MSKSSKAGSKRSRRDQKNGRKQVYTAPYKALTADQLRAGLVTLPQELYDEIFQSVFSAPSSTIRYINKETYKPPVQLQVSQETRKLFSKNYYGAAEASWIFVCGDHDSAMRRWWKSLDPDSIAVLCEVRPGDNGSPPASFEPRYYEGEAFRYYPPPYIIGKSLYAIWYRWVTEDQKGIGKLFEVKQFCHRLESDHTT